MTNEFGSEDPLKAFSEPEKASVRDNLRVFMHENPARAPFYIRAMDSFSARASDFMRTVQNPTLQFVSGSVALVFVAGSGTAFAAGNALPGDSLYGLKVNLEEPIQGVFATSAQAQANWNAQLASRRLSEAEQLAAQNKLTPSAASTISSGLAQATENFDVNVAQLATSSSNNAATANLESTMEATLAANTQVLNEIASAVPAAAPSIAPILSSVQERTTSLNTARTQLDIAAAQSNTAQVQVAAEAQLSTAQDQLNGIALQATSSNSNSAVPQAQEAEASIKAGRRNLDQGNYIAALETLQSASVEANEAQVNISEGQQLKNTAGIQIPIATSSPAFPVTSVTSATSSVATSTPSGISTSTTDGSAGL